MSCLWCTQGIEAKLIPGVTSALRDSTYTKSVQLWDHSHPDDWIGCACAHPAAPSLALRPHTHTPLLHPFKQPHVERVQVGRPVGAVGLDVGQRQNSRRRVHQRIRRALLDDAARCVPSALLHTPPLPRCKSSPPLLVHVCARARLADAFFVDHLPHEPADQFLPEALTPEQFFRQVPRDAAFFSRQLRLLSHPNHGTIECWTPLMVVSLYDTTVERGLEPSSSFFVELRDQDGNTVPRAVLAQRRDRAPSIVDVVVMLPARGVYVLALYVGHLVPVDPLMATVHPTFKPALRYRLVSHASTTGVLPQVDSRFLVTVLEPLAGVVPPGDTLMRIRVDALGQQLAVWSGDCDGNPTVTMLHASPADPTLFVGDVTLGATTATDKCMLCLCVPTDGRLEGIGLVQWQVTGRAPKPDFTGGGAAATTAADAAAGSLPRAPSSAGAGSRAGSPARRTNRVMPAAMSTSVNLSEVMPPEPQGAKGAKEEEKPAETPGWFSCCTSR